MHRSPILIIDFFEMKAISSVRSILDSISQVNFMMITSRGWEGVGWIHNINFREKHTTFLAPPVGFAK